MERETRTIPIEGLEVRAGEDGEPRGIGGTAALYNREHHHRRHVGGAHRPRRLR